MLVTRQDIVAGIDIPIDGLQKKMYPALKKAWNINNDLDYQCYSRCYRNKIKDGFIAEIYTGVDEYKELFLDDTLIAHSFFGVGDVKIGLLNTTTVHLVFFVNLEKIKGGRLDEQVRLDVHQILNQYPFGFIPTKQVTGVEKSLAEYAGSRRDHRLQFADMHPYHVFRFEMDISYKPFKSNC